MRYFRFGGIFIGIFNVTFDCSGKQHRFLRDIPDLGAQIMLRHFPHIYPVNQHFAAGNIVKTRYQVDQSCFTAACTADKSGGLAGLRDKADMLQYIIFRARIAEGDILEFHRSFQAGAEFLRFFRINNDRFGFQHFADSLRRNTGPRKHNKYYCQEKEGHDNLHGVLHESHHAAHLHRAGINPVRAHPDNQNHNGIHQEHHRRHHKYQYCAVDEQVCFGQILVCLIKPFLFMFLRIECADDHQTGKYFTHNQVQLIDQGLHRFEFRKSNREHHQHHRQYDTESCGDNP